LSLGIHPWESVEEVSDVTTRYLLITSLLLMCYPTHAGQNISYSKVFINGARVHVVTVNLNSPDLKVTVSLTKKGSGSAESFTSMLNRLQPAAAITGTFFCTRSLQPTGDIVIEGTNVHKGVVGTGVCFTADNTVRYVPFKWGHSAGWEGYDTVLCAGPTLVRNGSIFLCPKDQGFTDPGLFGKKKRTALGTTASNKLLLVVVDKPIQLRTLAKIMLSLGAVDAVDLDGGSSSALYHNGRTISHPGRKLTNLLVVYDSLTDYYHHRQALAPQFRNTVAAVPRPKMTELPPVTLASWRGPIADTTHMAQFPIQEIFPDAQMAPPTVSTRPLNRRRLDTPAF